MNALNLEWRTVTDCHEPKYMVRGTILADAYAPNTHCRFLIEEVRTFDGEYSGVRYQVRDAATVTMADVINGKFSQIVFRSECLDECLAFCYR